MIALEDTIAQEQADPNPDAQKPKEAPTPPVSLALPLDPPVRKHKRSFGLRLFDITLYPLITNIGVFVISVMATYLTTRGGDKDAAGKLVYGKTGEFFQKRGEWLVGKFKNMGMNEKSADMSKMVFFSFLDGSFMAPLVKLFEDRREQFGRWLDKKCGTTPDDDSVYAKEPKQSWLSVLGGRAATAFIVVNTALALDKTGLNDKLFIEPGKKIGQLLKANPRAVQLFGKYDVGELAKVSIFEFVYTSICTAGLYFSSRFFAKGINKCTEQKEQALAASSHSTTNDASEENVVRSELKASGALLSKRPAPAASHRERLANSPQGFTLAY